MKNNKLLFVACIFLYIYICSIIWGQDYKDPSQPVSVRVADPLEQNNTPAGWSEKYDNLQNAALQTRLGIPILFGVDAVHGFGNVYGTTIFLHNIGLGAA